jgi:hypothetical protein
LILHCVLSALLAGVVRAKGSQGIGFHLATRGLLQTHASLTGRGVALYPAHAPDHNIDDDEHLAPAQHHVLYYAQEGHRREMFPHSPPRCYFVSHALISNVG